MNRCKDCMWWLEKTSHAGSWAFGMDGLWGDCQILRHDNKQWMHARAFVDMYVPCEHTLVEDNYWGRLHTASDFGCVQWEANDRK